MELQVFEHTILRPFAAFGYTGSFWEIYLDTLQWTWLSMAVLAIFVVFVRLALRSPMSPFMYGLEQVFGYFMTLVEESIGSFDKKIFGFVMSVFFFVLFNNVIEVFPFVQVATSDVNTTFAISTSCFMYVQYKGLQYKGFGYFKKFFSPFFLFFPMNVLGQLAKIMSMSFRLFGNILSGTIIVSLLHAAFEFIQPIFIPLGIFALVGSELCERYVHFKRYPKLLKLVSLVMILCSILPGAQLAFCIGEGTIQAYVICLLTTMYVSSEISAEGGH